TLRPFGGHNVLEPAALGVPVLHGPWVANCRLEAEALARAGGGLLVRDAELDGAFQRLLADPAARATAAAGAIAAGRALRGATDRVWRELSIRGLWPPRDAPAPEPPAPAYDAPPRDAPARP